MSRGNQPCLKMGAVSLETHKGTHMELLFNALFAIGIGFGFATFVVAAWIGLTDGWNTGKD